MTIKWVPGHSRIQGNLEADSAARSGLRMLPSPEMHPESTTLAFLYGQMNRLRQALLDDWWNEACPPRYRKLDLLMRRRKPPELGLSRFLLRNLIAARTGHGNFAAHHRRFNNLDAIMECACGEETTPTHFIHCRLHAHVTRRLRGRSSHSGFIQKLLGPKCHEFFKIFEKETCCFGLPSTNSSSDLIGDNIN